MSEHPSNETLQAYLDGELAASDVGRLEAHLANCSSCAEDLAQLRSLFLVIDSLPAEELELDLSPGVVAAIQSRSDWLPKLAIGELVAATGLTAVLVVWLGGAEIQGRVAGAAVRLSAQINQALATLISIRPPEIPEMDLAALGKLVESMFVSPAVLWAVVAGAAALWLVGNGLVLRFGKNGNV